MSRVRDSVTNHGLGTLRGLHLSDDEVAGGVVGPHGDDVGPGRGGSSGVMSVSIVSSAVSKMPSAGADGPPLGAAVDRDLDARDGPEAVDHLGAQAVALHRRSS